MRNQFLEAIVNLKCRKHNIKLIALVVKILSL